MSDTPEALDIDLGGCRGIVWAGKCANALSEDEGLNHMRKFVRHFKRKGGDGGEPGNFDEFIKNLLKAGRIEEEEGA